MGRWITLAALVCAGCGRPHELYPLKVGNQWRYKVNAGIVEFVNSLDAAGTVPTEQGNAVRLTGTMGDSILAWRDGVLIATQLAGTRFHPPMPILDGRSVEAEAKWEGTAFSGGKTYKGTATIAQSEVKWDRGVEKRDGTGVLVKLLLPDRVIEVETTYVRGFGPVTQVQRTTQRGVQRFEYGSKFISGP